MRLVGTFSIEKYFTDYSEGRPPFIYSGVVQFTIILYQAPRLFRVLGALSTFHQGKYENVALSIVSNCHGYEQHQGYNVVVDSEQWLRDVARQTMSNGMNLSDLWNEQKMQWILIRILQNACKIRL